MSDRTQLTYVSATQLTMAGKCLEQYRRRYILGDKVPPGIALIQGTGFHAGAEANFKQKIDSHEDLPAADIVEQAMAAFEAELANGIELTEQEQAKGRELVVSEAKDQLAIISKHHAIEQAPDYQPVAVEHETRIPLDEPIGPVTEVLAITDLRDDLGRVIDFKTASRRPPQRDADESVQLTIYAMANAVDTGEMPTETRLDVVTKTKKPQRHILVSPRTTHDVAALRSRLGAMLRNVSVLDATGVAPWPAAPVGAWWCDKRFCGYWHTCPHINQNRQPSAEDAWS